MLDDANGADGRFRFQFRYDDGFRRALGHIHQQQIHRYLLQWSHHRRIDAVIVIAIVFDPNDFRIGCTA